MTGNIGSGFRNADGDLFGRLVRCLDFANDHPFFKAYKAYSWETLRIEPRQVILDVACGTGADLIQLASQYPSSSFIGVDHSESFLALAKERAALLSNIQFLPGDAQHLPLGDQRVDAVRIDRSLQHMETPAVVLKEMARVTKPGGRVVGCEPDWETFVLFNGEFEDSVQLASLFRHSIRNPFIGRELASLMNECGIKNLQTHVHAFWTNKLEDADVIFDLRKVAAQCADADLISEDDADNWVILSKQATKNRTFFAGLNIVQTSGIID